MELKLLIIVGLCALWSELVNAKLKGDDCEGRVSGMAYMIDCTCTETTT